MPTNSSASDKIKCYLIFLCLGWNSVLVGTNIREFLALSLQSTEIYLSPWGYQRRFFHKHKVPTIILPINQIYIIHTYYRCYFKFSQTRKWFDKRQTYRWNFIYVFPYTSYFYESLFLLLSIIFMYHNEMQKLHIMNINLIISTFHQIISTCPFIRVVIESCYI